MYSAATPVEKATKLRCTIIELVRRADGRSETTKRAKSVFLIISLAMALRGSVDGDVLWGWRKVHMEVGLGRNDMRYEVKKFGAHT